MRAIARSLGVAVLAVLGAIALAVSWALTTAVQLLATTALIMGGTQDPLVNPNLQEPDVDGMNSYALSEPEFASAYMAAARTNYIAPSGADRNDSTSPDGYTVVAVYTPEEFFPVYGSKTFDQSVAEGRSNLDTCVEGGDDCVAHLDPDEPPDSDTFVVFGYSSSAVIASLVKQDLINRYETNPVAAPDTTIDLIANPMRPNGGFLARGFEGLTIPILGVTFYGPTPTDSDLDEDGIHEFETVDVAQQYDAFGGDFPADPLNLLAVANSIAAFIYLHGQVPSHSLDDPTIIDQGEYGDTHYYLIPAQRLPLLIPLEQIGVPGSILAVVDAPLRVMVEAGYVRDKSPGEHVQFTLLPSTNPISFIGNLAGSIPVGIDDGLQEAGLGRPLNTDDVFRPYGVGGETFDKPENAVQSTTSAADRPAAKSLTDGARQGASLQEKENLYEPDGPTPGKANTGTSTRSSTPEITKPRPLRQLVRGPVEFDRPKPTADRPSGDRPLQKAVKALTGQRPTAKPDDADKGETPENKTDDAA